MTPLSVTFHQGGPALKRRSNLNFLSIACVLLALWLFGHSAYILAKAQLAQVLLNRAFDRTIATGQPVKAWSWADTWPVARVEVARIGASAIVLQGTSGEAMAFGPGLMNETAAIGAPGTSVIAAHRDTHFAFLKHVVAGDLISITRNDGTRFNYRVTGMEIVDWNRSGIDRHAAGFNLVLATCYPFDAVTRGPQRYLVKAEMAR
jgi:sortase A